MRFFLYAKIEKCTSGHWRITIYVTVSKKASLRETQGFFIPPYFHAKKGTANAVPFGGDKGIRTPDLYVANVSLSQLSYIPKMEARRLELLTFRV